MERLGEAGVVREIHSTPFFAKMCSDVGCTSCSCAFRASSAASMTRHSWLLIASRPPTASGPRDMLPSLTHHTGRQAQREREHVRYGADKGSRFMSSWYRV